MPNVIPIPELGRVSEYAVPDKHACLAGDLVVVQGPKGIAGVSLSKREPIWHYPYDPEPNFDWPDDEIRTWRKMDSAQWISADQSMVVTLVADRQLPHLVAIDARNGRLLWDIEIQLPREMLQKVKGIHTGWDRFRIDLELVQRSDALALCCVRYMSEHGLHDHEQVPGESTFLVRIEPTSGSLLWSVDLPDVRAVGGTIEFSGLFLRGAEVGEIDWQTGQSRVVHERPGVRTWPIPHHGGFLLASVEKGKLIVERIDGCGTVSASAPWKRTGVKAMRWWSGSPMPVLQLNSQSLVFVDSELAPRWEARAKPWIYGAGCAADGPVVVATNGASGHLLGFDRDSGQECLRFTPKEGGTNDLTPIPGSQLHICSGHPGLLCTDGHRVEAVAFGGRDDDWQLLGLHQGNAVFVSVTGQVRARLVPIPIEIKEHRVRDA